MKILTPVAVAVIAVAVLVPVRAAFAESHEGSPTKQESSEAKQLVCSPAHMDRMLKYAEDRECVVEAVLKNEHARKILVHKIAADPELRKEVMKKSMMMKHKDMTEEEVQTMMEEQCPMMKEGGMSEEMMEKHRKMHEMMHGEGSMMKQEGSPTKQEGSPTKAE
ncbi:MAG: hypothetical protein Kow0099_30900 [Candidatus Abyssubacteria bacterium]